MKIPPWVNRPLTISEQSKMRSFKRTAFIVAVVVGLTMLSGCTTAPGWGIVNNTGYNVNVVQDGKVKASLAPGQAIELVSKAWRDPSLVSVVAYDSATNYVGANSYTFSRYTYYNWQVDHVFKPEGAR